jgi:hypothetical protein
MSKKVTKTKRAKKTVSRFVVSFAVEVEYDGEPEDARCDVANAITDMVDLVLNEHGGEFHSTGVKITDAVEFGAEIE